MRSMPYAAAARVARARTEQHAVGGRLGDAHRDRRLAVVQQPLEHPAATAQHAVQARPARQAKRPGPAAGATSTRSSTSALSVALAIAAGAEQVHVHQQRAAAHDLHELGRARGWTARALGQVP